MGGFLGSCITAAAFISSDFSFYAQTPIKNLVASTDAEFPEVIYTFVDRLQKSAMETEQDLYAVPENSDQFDYEEKFNDLPIQIKAHVSDGGKIGKT